MRRSKTVLVPMLAIAAVAVSCTGDHAEEGSPQLRPVRAEIALAERITIPETVSVRGTVEAERTAVVSTRVMASVIAVHVSAGDRVERGDVLVEIDPQASRGQVAQAEGALAQARAALVLAEKNFRRFEALAERDAASELEVDQARAQLDQATAAVEQASGAVAAARSVASDARVVAPFAGRVAGLMIEPGDLAAPGRPLVRIESGGARRLVASLPESTRSLADLSLGDPVSVTLDTRSDLDRIQGRVVEISPGADPGSHAFQVEIVLPIEDLATGIAGRAWIETGERVAVVVPEKAVLSQGGLGLVVLRDESGRTSTRVVTTGSRVPPNRVEILAGLTGGEELLSGLGSIPPAGSPVEGVTP